MENTNKGGRPRKAAEQTHINAFKEAKHTLKAIDSAHAHHNEVMKRPLDRDFDYENERVIRQKERRMKDRERALPKDRKCPSCLIEKPQSRQWSLKGKTWSKETLVCRSCEVTTAENPDVEVPDLADIVSELGCEGQNLRLLRLAIGVSTRDFGHHCGWSGSYQARLERKDVIDRESENLGRIMRTVRILTSCPYRN